MSGFEEFLVGAAAAITTSIVASTITFALINRLNRRRAANPARAEKARQRGRRLARWFTRALLGLLGVGLVWTLYFMVVGLADPVRSEWAANASTLIVSVLTVVSIMIAFFEFMQRDKNAGDDGTGTPK